jgi:hypothetical protein
MRFMGLLLAVWGIGDDGSRECMAHATQSNEKTAALSADQSDEWSVFQARADKLGPPRWATLTHCVT